MEVAAATALVGTGVQVVGDIVSANDQANLDRLRAGIAEQQATELGGREVANEAIRAQQAVRQKLQFAASFAASGNAGTGVGSQLQLQSESDLQSMISNEETQFQQKMLHQQAGIDTTLAEQTITAGGIAAAGAGIGGLAKAGGMMASGYGGTQSLGSYPGLGGGSAGLKLPALGSSAGYYGGG